jgi:hypothetical protein
MIGVSIGPDRILGTLGAEALETFIQANRHAARSWPRWLTIHQT